MRRLARSLFIRWLHGHLERALRLIATSERICAWSEWERTQIYSIGVTIKSANVMLYECEIEP